MAPRSCISLSIEFRVHKVYIAFGLPMCIICRVSCTTWQEEPGDSLPTDYHALCCALQRFQISRTITLNKLRSLGHSLSGALAYRYSNFDVKQRNGPLIRQIYPLELVLATIRQLNPWNARERGPEQTHDTCHSLQGMLNT